MTAPTLVDFDDVLASYDPAMGLEVHVELNTATKIISWINIGLYAALIVGFGLVFLVAAILSAAGSV